MTGGRGHTSVTLLHQSAMWYRAVSTHCFYTTLCFILSAMVGKIKFCVKLSKSATESLDMPCEAFGEYSLSHTVGFWMIFPFQSWSSVSWKWRKFRATKNQKNNRKCWNNLRTHPRRLLPNNPWACRHRRDQLWSLQEILTENFKMHRIMTTRLPTRPWKSQSL
jgi:hypothetical protein